MIRLLTAGDMHEVSIYLERNYLETVSLGGNLERCGIENDHMSRRSGDYYGYFAAGQLRGILAFFNLGSVIPHFEVPEAVGEFASLMRLRRWKVTAGVKRVAEPLCQAQAKPVLAYEDSHYLANYAIKPRTLPESFAIAEVETVDRMLALRFIVEAYRLGFQRRFNQELAARLIHDRSPEEAIVFLLAGGVPQALAMVQAVTGQVHQIGGVYTREGSRGRGYCQALVSSLCQRSKSLGKIPVLMVHRDNIPAVRAYESIGFTYVTDYLVAKF